MKEYDKLSTRLSQILIKFNNGDRVTIEDLAEEFGVSKRTIERDFVRFSYLPIIKENKVLQQVNKVLQSRRNLRLNSKKPPVFFISLFPSSSS